MLKYLILLDYVEFLLCHLIKTPDKNTLFSSLYCFGSLCIKVDAKISKSIKRCTEICLVFQHHLLNVEYLVKVKKLAHPNAEYTVLHLCVQ